MPLAMRWWIRVSHGLSDYVGRTSGLMIDRLTGLWRAARRPVSAEKVKIDGFELGSFTLHGDTRTETERPLRVARSAEAWSYLVSWPNRWTVSQIIDRGLRV